MSLALNMDITSSSLSVCGGTEQFLEKPLISFVRPTDWCSTGTGHWPLPLRARTETRHPSPRTALSGPASAFDLLPLCNTKKKP